MKKEATMRSESSFFSSKKASSVCRLWYLALVAELLNINRFLSADLNVSNHLEK
jgi:hypothetical protein